MPRLACPCAAPPAGGRLSYKAIRHFCTGCCDQKLYIAPRGWGAGGASTLDLCVQRPYTCLGDVDAHLSTATADAAPANLYITGEAPMFVGIWEQQDMEVGRSCPSRLGWSGTLSFCMYSKVVLRQIFKALTVRGPSIPPSMCSSLTKPAQLLPAVRRAPYIRQAPCALP
jgi:hypothetical protein